MTILLTIAVYFGILLAISQAVGRGGNDAFFRGNRQSPWYLVAFGMIGTTLSGVTFISIPGEVGNSQWAYLPLVLGNCVGYVVIALVLVPLFYRLNLVSIYSWLGSRFGERARLTGSFFFIVSQMIGASFRLFLVVSVLQLAFFDAMGIPFAATVFITIAFVWVYTVRGGITEAVEAIRGSDYSRAFDGDWRSGHNWVKQFVAGLAITVALNGLDQNMMQKNLTCRSLRDCQVNMYSFSFFFFVTNVLFLALGALLYIYAGKEGIALPEKTDEVFPYLALNHLGTLTGLCFLLGITAAAYSSVDSSLTALTTSFCIDFLKIDPKDTRQKRRRIAVHVGFSLLMVAVIVLFRELNNDSVINTLFTAVGYTYGPLLGLFVFGLTTKCAVREKYIPPVCLLAPILAYVLNCYSEELFWGYRFGFEILLLNGALCFLGLWLIRQRHTTKEKASR